MSEAINPLVATELEKVMYGDSIEVVSRDKLCTVYRLTDACSESGEDSLITAYNVFKGIQLVYRDVHSPHFSISHRTPSVIFEISHCREGRLEYETDDSSCYLMPGDIAVMHTHNAEYETLFPLNHYHGISVIIDLELTPKCLSCFLADVTVSPSDLADKFCADKPFFVARSSSRIEHIFDELYHVPEELRHGYFKVKVLELMLFLTTFDINTDESVKKSCPRQQVSLAKNVCRYLTEHISDRITLDELSGIFHVSGTTIKNSFKMVYGESVYTYIRTHKMQMAAEMLRSGDETIMEIAGRFGYDNASKFACAFKDVMGVTPNEYRSK